jgi:hypothetical protein
VVAEPEGAAEYSPPIIPQRTLSSDIAYVLYLGGAASP